MSFYALLFSLILSIMLVLASNKWIGLSLNYWYNPLVFINVFHLLVHTLLGSIWIVLKLADNSVVHKISDATIITWSYCIVYSVIVYVLILFWSHKADRRNNNWQEWYKRDIQNINSSLSYGLSIILLFFCLLSAIYVSLVSGFSFARVDQAQIFRYSVSRNFQGVIYIKTILFESMTPILGVIFYSFWLYKKNLLTLGVFIISFLLAFYSTTYSFAKSPFFIFLLTLLIVRITYKGVTRSVRVMFVVAMLLLVSFFVLVNQANDDIQFIVKQILDRIVVDEVAGSYLMYEIFPRDFDYIGFRSLSSLSELFGFEHSEPAARLAMEYAFGERAFKTMNLLSTYYLGEAWANFGWLGVIISPFYVSGIIILSSRYLRDITKSPFSVAFMSYMVIPSSITSQFNNFIFNSILLLIGFTFLIIRSVKS